MPTVKWPTARQSKGAGATEVRNAQKLKRQSSMTAVSMDQARFYAGYQWYTRYNPDTDTIDQTLVRDRSISLNGLIRSDPFALPADIKRQALDNNGQNRITLDEDSDRYNTLDQVDGTDHRIAHLITDK